MSQTNAAMSQTQTDTATVIIIIIITKNKYLYSAKVMCGTAANTLCWSDTTPQLLKLQWGPTSRNHIRYTADNAARQPTSRDHNQSRFFATKPAKLHCRDYVFGDDRVHVHFVDIHVNFAVVESNQHTKEALGFVLENLHSRDVCRHFHRPLLPALDACITNSINTELLTAAVQKYEK